MEEIVGSVNLEKVTAFLKLLAEGDLKGAISCVNNLQDQEYQIQPLIRFSVELLEKILVLQIDPKSADTATMAIANSDRLMKFWFL